jgi:excinuclease UvrABC ATPase subunit
MMKRRVAQYMSSTECPLCHGKRLRQESLSVKFAGMDIAQMTALPMIRLAGILRPHAQGAAPSWAKMAVEHPEKALVTQRISQDLMARLDALLDLGLGYLSLERSTPTLSPGELQRLRLATQARSNLFGVVYVLDEPSAGLHPADTEALLSALDQLKDSGNSLFVVEHDLDVIQHADWIVDVGPAAGAHGGLMLYSGPPAGLERVEASQTRRYLFGQSVEDEGDDLERISHGDTLYVLDEPTTGLHAADVERLIAQLDRLVDAGNTVVIVEHDMRVVAASDWVIDIGPGAGDAGGRIVASGTPAEVSKVSASRTAAYLDRVSRATRALAVT